MDAIEGIFVYGQSNAGHGGSQPAKFVLPLFPDECLAFGAGTTDGFQSETLVSPLNYMPVGLTALVTPTWKPMPIAQAIPIAFALEQFCRDAGTQKTKRFWHTVWHGGEPISTFVKGRPIYGALMAQIGNFKRIAGDAVGRENAPLKAIFFIQSRPNTRDYAAELYDLITTLLPDAREAAEQTQAPQLIVVQTGGRIQESGPNWVQTDQMKVGLSTHGVTIACPSYFASLEIEPPPPEGYDGIHATEPGRMMIGECAALCYKHIFVDGGTWNPLSPISVRREGRKITIQFQLPPGGNRLAWDDFVPLLPSDFRGFGYSVSDNSAEIQSVELGPDGSSVDLLLTAIPTGDHEIVPYAQGQSLSPPWPGLRGQLISPTDQRSLFNRLGHPVPRFVNHYCLSFEMRL